MLTGKVVWFNRDKGYGFIDAQGKNYFVHFSDIKQSADYKTLRAAETVRFVEGKNEKGLIAKSVESLGLDDSLGNY